MSAVIVFFPFTCAESVVLLLRRCLSALCSREVWLAGGSGHRTSRPPKCRRLYHQKEMSGTRAGRVGAARLWESSSAASGNESLTPAATPLPSSRGSPIEKRRGAGVGAAGMAAG
jgi:hypothetical protein